MQRGRRSGPVRIPFLCAVYLCCCAGAFAQSSWQVASRAQAGLEYDSNIFESSGRNVAARAGRFLMQTRVEKNFARWRLDADYAGALQIYPSYRTENKLLQDLNGGLYWRAAPRWRFFARGQATLKLYLDNVTDYGTTSGVLGMNAALTAKTALEISAETGQLDYAVGDEFDFTFTGAGLALQLRPDARWLLESAVLRRQLRYAARPTLTQTGVLQVLPQNDGFTAFRLAAGYSRNFYLRARLEMHTNRSNRDLFDYDRLQLHLWLGCNPARRWLLRAALMLQHKHYLLASSPVTLPELDAEREQSNFGILDLSRTLSAEVNLLLRVAFYNNETPVRGLFYHKMLLFSGLELHL